MYPDQLKEQATGVMWIHGDDYTLDIPELDISYAQKIVKNTNSIVICPDYTLSADHPYPAALNDCYDTLLWMKNNGDKLGIHKN